MQRPFWFLLVAALALAGCQYPPGSPPPEFGEAVLRNLALQIVDPEPEPEPGPPPFEGNRAALAIGRYQADEVKEPVDMQTTTIPIGGQ